MVVKLDFPDIVAGSFRNFCDVFFGVLLTLYYDYMCPEMDFTWLYSGPGLCVR